MRTLRGRLVLILAGLSLAGLVLMGLVSVVLLHNTLVDRIDDRLADLSHPWSHGGPPPGPPDHGQRHDGVPTDFRVVIFDRDGSEQGMLGRAGSSDSGPDLHQPSSPRVTTVPDDKGGDPWRVLFTRTFDGKTIALAQSLSSVEATVNELVVIELVVGAVVLVVLAVAAAFTVRLSLRPLTRIEQTADAIAAGDLQRRVPEADRRSETGRLGGALNTMLSRLVDALAQRESSEQRLRRFIADASHELRTPLTSIRGFAELYRRTDRPHQTDVDGMMGRIESEATRMGRLVDDMLLLARLDTERAVDVVEFDMSGLVDEVVRDARARAPERLITVEVAPDLRVLGDAARLRQVLTNLVSNALVHATSDEPIVVRARHGSASGGALAAAGATVHNGSPVVEVSVSDGGPGISREHAPQIFDRFYRARSGRGGDGTGLGLAIASALAEAHGGRIELRTNDAGGSTFSLLLPVG